MGFDSFRSFLPFYIETIAIRGLAESFGALPIEDYEKDQKVFASKRIRP